MKSGQVSEEILNLLVLLRKIVMPEGQNTIYKNLGRFGKAKTTFLGSLEKDNISRLRKETQYHDQSRRKIFNIWSEEEIYASP